MAVNNTITAGSASKLSLLQKGRGHIMMVNTYEIKDEKNCSGCRAAFLLVRYPEIAEKEKMNVVFKSKAENFAAFVREKAFAKAETEFNEYLESGGRRSAFPQREYRLNISVISESGGYISVKDEIISVSGGIIKSYALDIKTWELETETLCTLSDFTPNKPKLSYDGFYLRNGKPVLYNIKPLWENGDCRMRDIKRFFVECKSERKIFQRRVLRLSCQSDMYLLTQNMQSVQNIALDQERNGHKNEDAGSGKDRRGLLRSLKSKNSKKK